MLSPGNQAPLDVPVETESGEPTTLRALLDRFLVVYFYPKDLTPGCTLEAEEFRDAQAEFVSLGARVVGVSKDTCASHQKFIAKKNLPFSLISDPEHALMDAFGTWGERSFMGKKYFGTSRSTFLLDADGIVVHVWEQVKPAGHAADVLAQIRSLAA